MTSLNVLFCTQPESTPVCMDWLFAGSPDGLLRHWSERNNDLGWLLKQMPNMSQAELVSLRDKLKELR